MKRFAGLNWTGLVILAGLGMGCPLAARSAETVDAKQGMAPDDDYRCQGEYLGEGSHGRWGLQVVAGGSGKFTAALLAGGLPGHGTDGRLRTDLVGTREADQLILRSEDQNTTVTIVGGESALVESPQVESPRFKTGATASTSVGGETAQGLQLRKVSRRSPTLGAAPPPGSIVLFDGRDTEAFRDGRMSPEGWLQVGTEIIPGLRDFTMHLEFLLPYMPTYTSQERGNSGLYIQSRYEVQILDSFGTRGEFNECGSIYRYRPPAINMCLPPLVWQTYDLSFRAARFDRCGNKRCHANLTLKHNGVIVHNCVTLERKTGAGKPEGATLLPTKLQDHHDPVQFRNIWLVPHDRAYLQMADLVAQE